MFTIDHAEVVRQHVAEQVRSAERHALRRQDRLSRRAARPAGTRHSVARALRQLADRLEPQQRPGLTAVR